MSASYRPPVLEKVTDKVDALDWSALPDEPCDLNYRSTKALPRSAAPRTLLGLVLVPVLALPPLLLLRDGLPTALTSRFAVTVCLLASVGLFLALTLRKHSARRALPVALGPIFVWLLFRSMPLHVAPAFSVLLLMALALPLVVWLGDAVATHGVHWMSAHPQIDHATMMSWRADWRQRFGHLSARLPRRADLPATERILHDRVLKARRTYGRGFVWFVLTISLTGAAMTTLGQDQPRSWTGFAVSVAFLAVLMVACLLRNLSTPGGWRLTFTFLAHFICYGLCAPSPPWGFQSPTGGIRRRLGAGLFVLFVVCAIWLPLADNYRAVLDDPVVLADLSESSTLACCLE